MDLAAGTRLHDVPVDVVLGFCTNGRLDELREAAEVLRATRSPPPPTCPDSPE